MLQTGNQKIMIAILRERGATLARARHAMGVVYYTVEVPSVSSLRDLAVNPAVNCAE